MKHFVWFLLHFSESWSFGSIFSFVWSWDHLSAISLHSVVSTFASLEKNMYPNQVICETQGLSTEAVGFHLPFPTPIFLNLLLGWKDLEMGTLGRFKHQ